MSTTMVLLRKAARGYQLTANGDSWNVVSSLSCMYNGDYGLSTLRHAVQIFKQSVLTDLPEL